MNAHSHQECQVKAVKPMGEAQSLETIWEIPDDLWEKVEPVILEGLPPKATGRKRVNPRQILNGIIFRLRSGCQWNHLQRQDFWWTVVLSIRTLSRLRRWNRVCLEPSVAAVMLAPHVKPPGVDSNSLAGSGHVAPGYQLGWGGRDSPSTQQDFVCKAALQTKSCRGLRANGVPPKRVVPRSTCPCLPRWASQSTPGR